MTYSLKPLGTNSSQTRFLKKHELPVCVNEKDID